MAECSSHNLQPNDPEWKTVNVTRGDVPHVDSRIFNPMIGVGGYKCLGCDEGNVCMAMFASNVHSEVRMTPDQAREFAAELMIAIARADPKGAN